MKKRGIRLNALALISILFGTSESVVLAQNAEIPPVIKNLNPDISVVIDGNYYNYNALEAPAHLYEEMSGFGDIHPHEGGEHEHEHNHGFDSGFNLRHLEIQASAAVDPYFKGWATVGISEDGAELEEAVAQTTSMPWGLQLKLGKFFSDMNRINAQHAHIWNFTDAPLIHQLLLGEHGLNEKGVQLSWLAPTPLYLQFGIEALQGENEKSFPYIGEGELPRHQGPRLGVAWAKIAPDLGEELSMQIGSFLARGKQQEEHLVGEDGSSDHFLDGDNTIWGADFVFKYDPPMSYGEGTFLVEGGYLGRAKDLELVAHNNSEAARFIGNSLKADQDGFYLQTTYGFAPRWRVGLRGDLIGVENSTTTPDGAESGGDSSYRITGMLDWTATEFSRVRMQYSHSDLDLSDGSETVDEVFLQAVFSIGAHGAHSY